MYQRNGTFVILFGLYAGRQSNWDSRQSSATNWPQKDHFFCHSEIGECELASETKQHG